MKINQKNVQGILICSLAAIFVTLQFTLQVTPGIMVSSLMKDFAIDVIKVSILSSSYFYTYLLFQAPSGMLVDRFVPRKVLICAIFFSASSCFIFSFTNSFYLAVIIRMLMGLGSAPAISVAFALCSRWLPPNLFGLAIGLVESLAASGIALIQYILGIVIESTFGWRGAIILVSILGAILFVLVLLFVKDGHEELNNINQSSESGSILLVLKKPQAWMAGIYCGMMFIVIAGFASLWCIPYIQKLYSIDLLSASIGSSAIFLGAAIGAPFSGWVSDIIGRRKPIMYIFSIISLIISIKIIYLPPDSILYMYLLLGGLGFFCGAYMIPFALIKDITSQEVRGTAMGFTNMMCILFGAPIFQPVVSLLLSHSAKSNSLLEGQVNFLVKDYQYAFTLLPAGFIISIFTLFFIRETYCKPSD
ncbi:MAG: MFS transporter [Legionellales bacterium]|nr:MFS transporter [Legionellales bacterium]